MTSVPSTLQAPAAAAPAPPAPPAPQAPHAPPALAAAGAAKYVDYALALAFLAALLLVPPALFGGDKYQFPLFTKYMALALFAVSVDLIWGYTGLLSLGQGLFFGLGAYAVGYSLILQEAARAAELPLTYAPNMAMPDFMLQCRLQQVPSWIGPLIDIWLALGIAVLVPTILATVFGAIVFRRGVKGVYFSLITQALLMAVFMLVSSMRPYTGGVDGLTNLASFKIFGVDFEMMMPRKPPNPAMFYLITGTLVVCFLGCALLMHSKVGRLLTAIRDNENRVLALGYNAAIYKTFIFGLAGFLAGLAGALFVAANGSAGPQFFSIADSIEVVVFVAVGGRGTLIGPILGAVLVSAAKTYVNDNFKMLWPIVMGGLFIAVVLFLPDGILGGFRRLVKKLRGRTSELAA